MNIKNTGIKLRFLFLLMLIILFQVVPCNSNIVYATTTNINASIDTCIGYWDIGLTDKQTFPDGDTYVDENYVPAMYIGSWEMYLNNAESSFKFDLSSISGTVSSAKIYVYVTVSAKQDGYSEPIVNVYGSNDDSWAESTTSTPSKNVTISTSNTVSATTTKHWESFDVTSFVNTQVQGDGTATIVLTGDTSGFHNVTIFSSEHATYKPYLEVTYSSAPTVTSSAATSVTSTGATLNGDMTSDGGGTISEKGFVYSAASDSTSPVIGGTNVTKVTVSGTSTGAFTSDITGLTSGVQYYFKPYATNSAGTTYGTVQNFTTLSAPTVTSSSATSVTSTGATLNGNMTSDGNATISEKGFVYSAASDSTSPVIGGTNVTKVTVSGTSTGAFTSDITGLTSGVQYYFKPYATNSVGTTYGTVQNFTTLSAPTVTSSSATSVTSTGATLNGNMTSDGNATISEKGFVYSTASDSTSPVIGGTNVTKVTVSGTSTGAFTTSLTELTSGVQYYFKPYATNSVGTTYGTVQNFTTLSAPTVTSSSATSVTSTGATLNGNMTSDGNATISEKGFVYSAASDSTSPVIGGTNVTKVTVSGTSTGAFTSDITGLTSGVQYYFKPYATNSVGTTYGTVQNFTTLSAPTVTSSSATSVTSTGATLNGNMTSDGGYTISEKGFVYSAASDSTSPVIGGTNVTKVTVSGTSTGAFTSDITGLTSGVQYYFKPYATNSSGTTYGTVQNFTTLSAPTVTSSSATSVTSTGATLNGNMTSDGNSTISEKGFVYSTASDSTSPVIGGTNVTKVTVSGTSTGAFTTALTGLTSGVQYYFKPYATNSVGTTYGTVQNFTTLSAPTVTSSSATSVTSTGATLNGNMTSDGNVTISEKGFVYSSASDSTSPVIGGTNVTKVTVSGTSTGAFTTSLTELTSGVQYYFKPYATNSVGTTYGTVQNFTTLSAPTVTSLSATSVTSTGATLNGNMTSDGNATISEKGFVYSAASDSTSPVIGGTNVTKVTVSGTSTGAFTSDITGLTSGVQYYFKPYATNSVGTTYGTVQNFTTLLAPTVTSSSATSVTSSGATLNGNMTSDGGYTISEKGFVYCAASDSTSPVIGGTNVTKVTVSGTSTGAFTSDITGLSSNVQYYFKPYATNSGGTTYGTVQNFTTLSDDATLKSTSQIKGVTISDFGTPSASIDGVTSGSMTLTSAQGKDTSNSGSYVTSFIANDTSGTVSKIVKYASGSSTSNFSTTDTAYNGTDAITDGDFFIIMVTAEDSTVEYYKIPVTVTPSSSKKHSHNSSSGTSTQTTSTSTTATTATTATTSTTATTATTADSSTTSTTANSNTSNSATTSESTEKTATTPSTVSTTPTPETKASDTGVEIIINNKTEVAATATTTKEENKTITTITVNNEKVIQKLENEKNDSIITIPVKNDTDVVVGQLNGQTVKNMEAKEAVLEIKTKDVTFTLPASQINIDSVSNAIGNDVQLKNIEVNVKIADSPAVTVENVLDTASKNNCQVVVKPIEFEISCTNENKTVEVSKFNKYVERTVAIPEGISPDKITTGIVYNADGTFSHVPTTITIIDGKYYAKINSLTNSTYSVIYNPKTFKDIDNHWAKDAIGDMASRLVVNGISKEEFAPDKDITRAEFAAIMVKGLGLMKPGTGRDTFSDVAKDSWYYDAVSIATEYKIISGYGNDKFGPNDNITREQAMTIIARAMKITNMNANVKTDELESIYAKYNDYANASEWAKDSIATCVKTGVVTGRYDKVLAPRSTITRAEVATIVRNLLQKSNLL